MAGPPKKKKVVTEEKTTEESLFLAEKNSTYNTLIPMLDAEYVRVRHPVLKIDIHMSTKSQQFMDIFKEFSEKGLGEKLEKELTFFAENYDAKWFNVLNSVRETKI